MKVYNRIHNTTKDGISCSRTRDYIMIANKKMREVGFTEGKQFEVSYSLNKICLEIKEVVI